MSAHVTLVLPVDEHAPATRSLAAGIGAFEGRHVGIVDNGLWRSMEVLVQSLDQVMRADGSHGLVCTPFDHLAPDFAAQQAALAPFAERIDAAVAGLGN